MSMLDREYQRTGRIASSCRKNLHSSCKFSARRIVYRRGMLQTGRGNLVYRRGMAGQLPQFTRPIQDAQYFLQRSTDEVRVTGIS